MKGIIRRRRAEIERRLSVRRARPTRLRREAAHYTVVQNDGGETASPLERVLRVATYNVHRWTGMSGGNRFRPELALAVLAELDVDVIGLQEVLRPHDAPDPLEEIAARIGLNFAFVCTRYHRGGDLGNAVLSRWPITSVFAMNLSFGRFEQRSALAAVVQSGAREVAIVATHLALLDHTRRSQVRSLLQNPRLHDTVVLLGDMNAWRQCSATRQLDRELTALHDNHAWPPSFPAQRPVLALDRIYARGAAVEAIETHDSVAARKGSDHLPVIARVRISES